MSLYAIGDLHLHFQAQLKSHSQLTHPLWRDHEERFRENCRRLIRPEDTLVLIGDHSWGRRLPECEEDLAYIAALPGRKILLRGNHDMFWDAKKTAALNEHFAGRLFFLQDDFAPYGEWALVDTKGYAFEGPFLVDRRGRVVDWDREAAAQAERLVEREAERLKRSFEAALAKGYRRFIVFLHYPPTNILQRESVFTRMAESYGASQLIYAHCHGTSRFHDSLMGDWNGIRYSLASGDYLQWMPMRVLP